MPNCSRAFAASCMISRSLSLPMTMETRGVLICMCPVLFPVLQIRSFGIGLMNGVCYRRDPVLLLYRTLAKSAMGDVTPELYTLKLDLVDGVVSGFHGRRKCRPTPRNAENASAGG